MHKFTWWIVGAGAAAIGGFIIFGAILPTLVDHFGDWFADWLIIAIIGALILLPLAQSLRETPTLRTMFQWGAYLFRQTREKLCERDESGKWRLRTPPSS